MIQILSIVVPVFGVILVGFGVVRMRYLSEGSDRFIMEFGYKVVMPAFLFRAMATAAPLDDPPFWPLAGYVVALVSTWITATLLTRAVLRRPAEDGAAIAMGATFGNSVMLGVPLAVSAFGSEAISVSALIVSIETPLLWLMATLHMEAALRGGRGISVRVLAQLARDLLRNPIIVSVLAGLLWRWSGLAVPLLADKVLAFLAAAALPVSLIALGMSLARFELKGQAPTLAVICLLKMVLYPLVAYVMLVHVVAVPPLWAKVGVLFTSMPVGANAFMFAAKYDRAVGSVSAAIGLSTAAAVLSASLVLWLVGGID